MTQLEQAFFVTYVVVLLCYMVTKSYEQDTRMSCIKNRVRQLTLRLLMSYIYMYGAPSKARNANVVYIWT